jgi:DNA-binding CsgD family transcriptional regulator
MAESKIENMKKKEVVYRMILAGAATQLAISKQLHISLSTVNNALKPLQEIGAVETRHRIRIMDKEKVLVHWANVRNLARDVVYRTRVDMAVTDIEKQMPDGVVFTGYSAYRLRYGEAPADYSTVMVYADDAVLAEIKRRFPQKKGPPNIMVLKPDQYLKRESRRGLVPDAQIFVDLWNMPDWHAKEYIKALKERIL